MVSAPTLPVVCHEHSRDEGHDVAALEGKCRHHDVVAWTTTLEPIPMRGRFKGADALMVCGGPSLAQVDVDALAHGRITLAVNNAGTLCRPNLWMGNDPPERFHDSIWLDPAIEKFVPAAHRREHLRAEANGRPMRSALRVPDAPNVRLYRRRLDFNPATFLTSCSLQIGCDRGIPCSIGIQGKRSTMFSALALLCHFGCRTVTLVGCDFKMDAAKPYAFNEERNAGELKNNNNSYPLFAQRFAALRPTLEAAGITVVNASPGSQLDAFDRVDWTTLVKPQKAASTHGWYRHRTPSK